MALTTSISVSVLVLVLSVEFSHGFFYGGGGTPQQPMCATPNKPCSIRITMTDDNGTEIASTGTGPMCTCSPPYQCSDDWGRRYRVISRKIISTVYNITLQMMFCKAVEPKTFCRHGEISLSVTGHMLMPSDISEYSCRCRRGQPLVLLETRIGSDRMHHQDYGCANHMSVCDRTQSCMTIGPTSSQYHCNCRRGLECHTVGNLIPEWNEERGEEETQHGYCLAQLE